MLAGDRLVLRFELHDGVALDGLGGSELGETGFRGIAVGYSRYGALSGYGRRRAFGGSGRGRFMIGNDR